MNAFVLSFVRVLDNTSAYRHRMTDGQRHTEGHSTLENIRYSSAVLLLLRQGSQIIMNGGVFEISVRKSCWLPSPLVPLWKNSWSRKSDLDLRRNQLKAIRKKCS